jgi:hypothetical protein
MEKLIIVLALLMGWPCFAQPIPIRVDASTEGFCAQRLAYFFRNHVAKSEAFALGANTPLVAELRAFDYRGRYGRSSRECHYTLRLGWYPPENRTQDRLTGTFSGRPTVLWQAEGDVGRAREVRVAAELLAQISATVRDRRLYERLRI